MSVSQTAKWGEVLTYLVESGLEVSLFKAPNEGTICADLNTGAKSGMYLHPCGKLGFRYDREDYIDMNQEPFEEVIRDLFVSWKSCLHGRDYYNPDWLKVGERIGLVEKEEKVITNYKF